ncbi:MAG: homoserine dehydrogenase [Dehalococcoidales bacterium]|jgi:homoserine dehydrogenase|nr:homoserine dehydrogenase [Dehalococcoidales bacterium]
MKKRSIGIGLMGLGVIGSQVARVLVDKAEILARQTGCPLVLKKIKVLELDLSRKQAKEMGLQLFTTDEDAFFATPQMDIVIEAIGGENPARQYLRRALSTGKHVVTSNKEVIAKYGAELTTLAQQNDVSLRYEASVGGGIPLIAPFQHDLIVNYINGIYAIINGTTNYILTKMSQEGMDFDSVLSQAQQLGYAETDPKNDIEGIDAAYKLAILASLAFQSQIRPDDIYREGISQLDSRDFRYAKELGFAIKLLAIAKRSDKAIEVRVHPAFVPQDSFLANVGGVYNAILVDGDLVGKVIFLGEGAGPLPTSSAVVADVVSAARDIISGVGSRIIRQPEPDKTIKPMAEIEIRYYIRMNVADKVGVLAQISQVLGNHNISISSVIQKETDAAKETTEIVIMTHPAKEAAVAQALSKLKTLEVIKEINNSIRVEI